MATFTIETSSYDILTSRTLVLECIQPGYYSSPSHCDVHSREEIYRNKYTSIFRATLRIRDGDCDYTHDVVLKTDLDAKLPRPTEFSREAEVYQALSKLQGVAIPICYGLYRTTIDDKCVSILVTEYSGEEILWLREEMPKLSSDFKAKAMNKLFLIHRAGFSHGDLEDRNLLNKDGEPFFIDLEHAKPHECKICQRVVMGDVNPGSDLGCREIWKFGSALTVWAGNAVHVKGFGCSFGYSRDMVSEANLDVMMKRINRTLHGERKRKLMRAALEKLVRNVEEWKRQSESITAAERSFTPTSSCPLVLTN